MVKKFFDIPSQKGEINTCSKCSRKEFKYELFSNMYYKTICKCGHEVWIYAGYLEDISIPEKTML